MRPGFGRAALRLLCPMLGAGRVFDRISGDALHDGSSELATIEQGSNAQAGDGAAGVGSGRRDGSTISRPDCLDRESWKT